MPFKTTDLSDACATARACELVFTGYGLVRAFSGRIRTVRCTQGLGGLRELVHQPGEDQVLVIDGGGSTAWGAVFGDVMAGLAMRHGWAGVVVHGFLRDRAEIDGMPVGVKALGSFPRRAAPGGPSEIDVPLHFGHAGFQPGARLVADEDGVLLLPPGLHEADIPVADALASTAAYAAGGGSRTAR